MRALMPSLVLLAAVDSFCRARAADERPRPAEKPRQNTAAEDETLEAYRRGLAAARAGQHDAAIAHFNAALYDIYLDRGRAYLEHGDHRQAVADFTSAIELEPKRGYAYFERGVAHAKMGEYVKALLDFREAIPRIEPAPPDVVDRAAREMLMIYARPHRRGDMLGLFHLLTGGKVPEELDKAMRMNERFYRMQFGPELEWMEHKDSFRVEGLKTEVRINRPLEGPEIVPDKR
jgi:tetratricopeptide (TPR) repeat protein